MSKFCSECGQLLNDGIEFCPRCGHKIIGESPAQVSVPNAEQSEKIYYQDNYIKIGSRIWEFKGKDSKNRSGMKLIPVQAISSVDFVYNKIWPWILLMICGVILIITGFILMANIGSDEPVFPIVGGFFLLLLGLIGWSINRRKGKLSILTNNVRSSYKIRRIRDTEAEKYIIPMRQCLNDRIV